MGLIELPQSRIWTPPERRVERIDRSARRRPFERRFAWSRTGLYCPDEPVIAAPGYVQSNLFESASGASSPQTVTLTGTTAGNLVCVIALSLVTSGNPGAVFGTPSDGHNTYHACAGASVNSTPNGASGYAFYASGINGGTLNISVAYTGGTAGFLWGLYAFELSGCNSYDNGGAGANNTTNVPSTTGPFTIAHSDVVACVCLPQNTCVNSGTGFTLVQITSTLASCIEYGSFGAGSVTATAAMDSSAQYWAIVAAGFYQASTGVICPFSSH